MGFVGDERRSSYDETNEVRDSLLYDKKNLFYL